jgi:hypothetical protein
MIDALQCTAGFGTGFLFGLALGCIATAVGIVAVIYQAHESKRGHF